MHLAELPHPSRSWLAALPLALLLIPRGDAPIAPASGFVGEPHVVQSAPSRCDDPYSGVWVARTHRDEHGDWHEYTLTLSRAGDELVGELDLRAWPGDAAEAGIPTCDDGSRMVTHYGEIPVSITQRGGEIRVDASHARLHRDATCRPMSDYSPDHFVGKLDRRGSLEMVNSDDGGWAHERPYEFVRMTCEP